MDRLFFRRSLPARSTMKSLPILTFCPTARCLGVLLGRLMMVQHHNAVAAARLCIQGGEGHCPASKRTRLDARMVVARPGRPICMACMQHGTIVHVHTS